ncbi:hypothetical protein EDB85DRAFT_1954246 [Lactarius pseudohatsudake]|nr:hypothetical protein EDB85DRAFT_1954246 [Lactarius pseudohatsudake]
MYVLARARVFSSGSRLLRLDRVRGYMWLWLIPLVVLALHTTYPLASLIVLHFYTIPHFLVISLYPCILLFTVICTSCNAARATIVPTPLQTYPLLQIPKDLTYEDIRSHNIVRIRAKLGS